jgi:hypothetical protein
MGTTAHTRAVQVDGRCVDGSVYRNLLLLEQCNIGGGNSRRRWIDA